jgi:catechol 2,3-dioxygenase-like lactoylglutathione lyase family enzyme
MSRVQLALRVSDLAGSIEFYRSLFGVEPAKRRPGYANFAITEPALKLVLIEGEPDQPTVLDHLGVEVGSSDEVHTATARLSRLGLLTQVENDTTSCYALQDKVWVHGPGGEPWEVYTVKADAFSNQPADASHTRPVAAAGDSLERPGSRASEAPAPRPSGPGTDPGAADTGGTATSGRQPVRGEHNRPVALPLPPHGRRQQEGSPRVGRGPSVACRK